MIFSNINFLFQVPNLYENFVASQDSDSEPAASPTPTTSSKEFVSSPVSTSPVKPEKPKIGHTIYVFGYR